MTERTRRIYEMPPIAYASACGGIEIKQVEDDYVICISNAWRGRTHAKAHRVKIYEPNGRSFINVCGHRIFLDECLRTGL